MIAFLPSERLIPMLAKLNSRLEVVAPIDVEGMPVFASWKGQSLSLSENPLAPPQEFLLPHREVLFKYIQYSGRYTFEEIQPRPKLIFGIRPCDLKAVAILDDLFSSEPQDHPYLDKRRSTVLVTLNCTQPGERCFCTVFAAGPDCEASFDLQFTEIREGYLVETGSSAGVMILKEHPEFFLEAQRWHLEERHEIMNKVKGAMQAREKISLPQIKDAIRRADWDALGRQCLNCGGCSFVCPVCHCFNILDLGIPDGERFRCRDTCILSGFSRMTGGVNPRKSKSERMRNWYLDKFEYIPERTGLMGCVGCGRCSSVCLAEIDRWKLDVMR